jgi:hypothetical protein
MHRVLSIFGGLALAAILLLLAMAVAAVVSLITAAIVSSAARRRQCDEPEYDTPRIECPYEGFQAAPVAEARRRRAAALSRLSADEFHPAADGDGLAPDGLSLLAAVVRRSPPAGGRAGGRVGAPLGAGDIDSDFRADGFYDSAALKENLRSGPGSAPATDSRFDAGPQKRVGDASPSHGGHAGGITLGGFGSADFR